MVNLNVSSKTPFVWSHNNYSNVPYRVYTDPDIYNREQQAIFRGPTWHFLCLDIEIPNPGDYKTTQIGDTPIIVIRDERGEINALVNRCSHKGALLCYQPRGNIQEFRCVYHNWTFDLNGRLTGVAFRRGVRGKGGLEADFDFEAGGLEVLRVENIRGLVFGTFSKAVSPFSEYLGEELIASIDRVFVKPVKVIGYYSQIFPNNWKLYAENNKDSYHASLLHVFHNTFGVVRPNMNGGIKLSEDGWHHLSYTDQTPVAKDQISTEKVRSLDEQYSLEDPSLMEHHQELGDTVTNSIQTIFPTTVIQQILNALAIRQLCPRGVDQAELMWTILGFADDNQDMISHRVRTNNLVGPAGFISMEDGVVGSFIQRTAVGDPTAETVLPMGGKDILPSEGSRITEAAVRGFWKGWRELMDV